MLFSTQKVQYWFQLSHFCISMWDNTGPQKKIFFLVPKMFQLFLIYPIWGRWLQNCNQVFSIRSGFPAMMHLLYRHNCCNLSGGVALIVWFTTNGMRVNNNTIIYGRQASNSKRDCDTWSLLLLAATVRSFAHMLLGISDRNKMVRWPWCEGSCQVQPSHKERAIGAVCCKTEGMLLQPLRWCCVDCVIHHKQDVREQ